MSEPRTIGRLFLQRCQATPDDNAAGWIENGAPKFITYRQYRETVEHLSLGLQKYGVNPADRLGIIGSTSKEWHMLDVAALCARAVVIPIYPSLLPEEMNYIIGHAECSVLAFETTEHCKKLQQVAKQLPPIKLFVTFREAPAEYLPLLPEGSMVRSIRELIAEGAEDARKRPEAFVARIQEQPGTDIASIIYTSGTTGEPKGALITQDAFASMLENVRAFLGGAFDKTDRTLTFLPLSHVFGRAESFIHLIFGWEMVFAESIEKILDNLPVARPTVMFAVPRIFEKLYARVREQIEKAPPSKQKMFAWARGVSDAYFAAKDRGEEPGFFATIKRNLAYKLVFSKIYERFGGRVKYFVSGGAPLSADIMKFLRNANLVIMEGYGLTETVAPCCINPPERQIPGTIGKAMGEVQMKAAEDGEILIKTRAMFTEYYKNPSATAEAIQDGWFHSGDIGEITPDGHWKITDRKKDLIITSGGKNVAPQKIENLIKAQRYVSHCAVVGDKRNYLTALVGIEREKFSDRVPIAATGSFAELAGNPEIQKLIEEDIKTVNAHLAKFETIKKFKIIPEDVTVESGLITPSLKLKKKIVFQRYAGLVEEMYAGAGPKD